MTQLRLLAPMALAAVLAASAAHAETIEGVVEFTGTPPVPQKLNRAADPYCAKTPMTDPSVLVKAGKLANVWVHVTKGAEGVQAKVPEAPVSIDQKDCMYVPRVATAVVGQKISAKNDDPILHNVHAYSGASTLFNKGMPSEKSAPVQTATKEEGLIRLKCDVHTWMRGYVGVSKNGLQAVTGEDGAFKIADVPPGKYTVEAWHERYGTKSQEVTVTAGKPAKVVFKYDGTEKGGM